MVGSQMDLFIHLTKFRVQYNAQQNIYRMMPKGDKWRDWRVDGEVQTPETGQFEEEE